MTDPEVFEDAGKQCSSGQDCLSGKCEIYTDKYDYVKSLPRKNTETWQKNQTSGGYGILSQAPTIPVGSCANARTLVHNELTLDENLYLSQWLMLYN